jgi:hypothetical protein
MKLSELLGSWALSIVGFPKKLQSTTFQKLDQWGELPILLGPLEVANLSHWNMYVSITVVM